MGRISGPLIDRFDLRVDVPAVDIHDLSNAPSGETSAQIATRVKSAWNIQRERFSDHDDMRLNSDAEGAVLEEIATPDTEGHELLIAASDKFGLTARGYHRVLRVARTIADLDGAKNVRKPQISEALSFRLTL